MVGWIRPGIFPPTYNGRVSPEKRDHLKCIFLQPSFCRRYVWYLHLTPLKYHKNCREMGHCLECLVASTSVALPRRRPGSRCSFVARKAKHRCILLHDVVWKCYNSSWHILIRCVEGGWFDDGWECWELLGVVGTCWELLLGVVVVVVVAAGVVVVFVFVFVFVLTYLLTKFLQSDFEVEWATLKGLNCWIYSAVFVPFWGIKMWFELRGLGSTVVSLWRKRKVT